MSFNTPSQDEIRALDIARFLKLKEDPSVVEFTAVSAKVAFDEHIDELAVKFRSPTMCFGDERDNLIAMCAGIAPHLTEVDQKRLISILPCCSLKDSLIELANPTKVDDRPAFDRIIEGLRNDTFQGVYEAFSSVGTDRQMELLQAVDEADFWTAAKTTFLTFIHSSRLDLTRWIDHNYASIEYLRKVDAITAEIEAYCDEIRDAQGFLFDVTPATVIRPDPARLNELVSHLRASFINPHPNEIALSNLYHECLAVVHCNRTSDETREFVANIVLLAPKKTEPIPHEFSRKLRARLLAACYMMMFDENADVRDNLPTLHYFFESASRSRPVSDFLMTYCTNLQHLVYEQRQLLVDALPFCDLKETLLEELREERRKVRAGRRTRIRLVYDDPQSVHNAGIAEFVDAAREILDDNDVTEQFAELCEEFTSKVALNTKQKRAIREIRLDATKSNLKNAFSNIWLRIKQSPNKKALTKRLQEELTEMSDTCPSGFLSRLLNVMTGFEESLGIEIGMSFADEINAGVIARFNKAVAESDRAEQLAEEAIEGSISLLYDSFKQLTMLRIHDDMLAEYTPLFSDNFTESTFELLFTAACQHVE